MHTRINCLFIIPIFIVQIMIVVNHTYAQEPSQEATKSTIKTLLNSRNWSQRRIAAEKLGEWGSKKAVPDLIEALDDEVWEVQVTVAFALGKIGDEKATQALLNKLSDRNWYIRQAVAEALGKIKDETAIPGLISTLREECDEIIRRREEVPRMDNFDSRLTADNTSEVIIGVIIERFGQATIPYLKPIIENENESKNLRYDVALILGNLDDKSSIPLLIDALENEQDGHFRSLAAIKLGKLGDKSAIPSLTDALDDPYYFEFKELRDGETIIHRIYRVRSNASLSLKKLGVDVIQEGSTYKVKK